MTLFDFITPLKKWWWLLVISSVIAGAVSFIITERQPETYQSRATLMIGQTIDDPNPSSSDLYLEQQLAINYANMANRSQVRQATMNALGLEWLPQYRVIAPPNTQLLEITVVDTNPQRSQAVAQEIANQLILRSPSGTNSEDQERQIFITEQLNTLQIQTWKILMQLGKVSWGMKKNIMVWFFHCFANMTRLNIKHIKIILAINQVQNRQCKYIHQTMINR